MGGGGGDEVVVVQSGGVPVSPGGHMQLGGVPTVPDGHGEVQSGYVPVSPGGQLDGGEVQSGGVPSMGGVQLGGGGAGCVCGMELLLLPPDAGTGSQRRPLLFMQMIVSPSPARPLSPLSLCGQNSPGS
jgi:hypothetical protein